MYLSSIYHMVGFKEWQAAVKILGLHLVLYVEQDF